MPRYILPVGVTPLDNVSNSTISNSLNRISENPLLDDGYKFTNLDKWDLFKFLQRFDVKGDGMPIDPSEVAIMRNHFHGFPKIHDILKSEFDKFWIRSGDMLKNLPDPTKNDMGFRFYIGESFSNTTGVVIVPMFGEKPIKGVRDRKTEKEIEFFKIAKIDFFALTLSDTIKGVSESVNDCLSTIIHKDFIGKEVVYFSYEAFSNFFNGDIEKNYEKMRVVLARTGEFGFATLIVMFLDAAGKPIKSSGKFVGGFPDGVFFDQGDLIPPPPNDPDGLRDTHFPRKS